MGAAPQLVQAAATRGEMVLQLLAHDDPLQADLDMTRAAQPLYVELLDPEAAAAHAAAWRALAANCLEPNVFFEPGFALAAARHLAKGRPPRFLFVWDRSASRQSKLVAVCPFAPYGRLARLLPTWVWTHEQAPLGTPLLDPVQAEAALAAIFAYCRTHMPHVTGLMFPLLPQEGPVARLLRASAAADTRGIRLYSAHQRAILSAGIAPQRYLEQSVGSARRRKLNKARKSLEAKGTLALRTVRDPHALGDATEAFLALEAKGWKGQHGAAFLKSPDRAAFARELAADLGHDGKYFVARLDLDGQPIAMALMLESGGRAFWWKITYDEDFAAFAPGFLLAIEMTRTLLDDPQIGLTDSCTGGEQPMMIDHIWSERMAIADLLVAVAADRPKRFNAIAKAEELRRTLRCRLKEIVLRLRQWKRARLLSRQSGQKPPRSE
ncbi:MAG: GNAT family N-acetyltransferase [Methylovirgula sp.]